MKYKIDELMNRKITLPFSWILLFVVLIAGFLVAVPKIQNTSECRESLRLYEESLSKLSKLDFKARSEWKAFPPYIATDEWSKWQEEEGYKDPGLPGGRIYPSFENYWKENYAYESAKEMRISSRIVVNNPVCFDPRTVSEEQEFLDN